LVQQYHLLDNDKSLNVLNTVVTTWNDSLSMAELTTAPYFYESILLIALKSKIIIILTYVNQK
jgi:hypothetical protein